MSEPNAGMSFAERALRHGASEVASTPGAIPALIGIGEAGARMLGGMSFEQAALSDNGRRLAEIINNDQAPPELRAAAADMFDPARHFNWGLRNATEWYEWGTKWGGNLDRKLGLTEGEEFERRPGEVPLDEEIAGIALAALPGLPAKVVASLGTKITQSLGRVAGQQFVTRIAQSTPGRISGKVVGATGYFMPGTFPLTPGNVAMNIGASTALNDVMRNLAGETSLIGEVTGENERIRQLAETNAPVTTMRARQAAGVEVALNGVDDPPVTATDIGAHRYIDYGNVLTIGGITGLALIGAAALRGRVASPSAGGSFYSGGTIANTNTSTSTPKLEQSVGAARAVDNQLFDSTSAMVETARKAGGDDAAERLELLASVHTRAGSEQMLNNVATLGMIGDTGIKTTPLNLIRTATQSLSRKRTFTHGITNLKGADSEYEFFSIATHARQALIDRQQMRTKASEAVRVESTKLSQMIASGRYTPRELTEQTARVTKAQQVQNASGTIRPEFENLSDGDLQRMVNILETNPRMLEVDDMYSKFFKDFIDAMESMGVIDGTKAREMRTTYGYVSKSGRSGVGYRPLHEDQFAGQTNAMARRFLKAGKELFSDKNARKNSGQPLNERSLDPAEFFDAAQSGNPKKVVNNPGDIITRLYEYAGNTLRHAEHNLVVRELVDVMTSNPTTARSLRKYPIGKNGATSVTKAQLASGRFDPPSHLVKVERGNNVEFWEFADQVIADSLQFNPYAAIPFFNNARRAYQAGTTGPLAPFWAPKGFLFDYFTAHITRPKGRSLGMLDSAVRKLSNDRMGVPGDPTFLLESIMGVGRGIYGSQTKALADWFVNDLAQSNGIFAQIAQSTVGRQWLESVGLKLHDAYLRSTLGIMDSFGRFGSTSASLKSPYDVGLFNLQAADSLAAKSWLGMVGSIHNGVKIAYFARNLADLQAKTRGPVSLADIRKLTHEARTIAGDMSKSGASETMNKITSAMPYANVMIQSMRHIYGGSMARMAKGDFAPMAGLFFGTFVPGYMAMQALSRANEQTDGAVFDWYYNKLPAWQRVSSIIFPNPLSENTGPFDPATDIIEIPIAPETVPLLQMARAWAESSGVIEGDQRMSGGLQTDTADAMGTLMNLAVPPPIGALAEGFGYRVYMGDAVAGIMLGGGRGIVGQKPGLEGAVDESQMRLNSSIHRDVRDTLAAVFGTSMRMIVESLDAGDAAADKDGLYAGMSQVLSHLSFEAQRRTPVANRALWGIDTAYRGNPMTEKYYQTISTMQQVFRMDENQNTGEVGGKTKGATIYPWSERPDLITRDVEGIPVATLRSAVALSTQMLTSGEARELASQIGQVDRTITMVDGNRAMDPRKRHEQINTLIDFRNRFAEALYGSVIQPWEQQMEQMLGKPVDADEFVRIMKQGVGG
jgi:hypothetical protein